VHVCGQICGNVQTLLLVRQPIQSSTVAQTFQDVDAELAGLSLTLSPAGKLSLSS
jgi:hypothetical protein